MSYKKHEYCFNYRYYFTYDTEEECDDIHWKVHEILDKAHKDIEALKLGVEIKCTD